MITEEKERYFKDEILVMDRYKQFALLLYDCLNQYKTYTLDQVDWILEKRRKEIIERK